MRASGSTDHCLGEGIDFFGVEQQIVLLEQTRDAGAMQREFESAEAQRAEQNLAMAWVPRSFSPRPRCRRAARHSRPPPAPMWGCSAIACASSNVTPAAPVASTMCAPSIAAPRSTWVGAAMAHLDTETCVDRVAGRLHNLEFSAGDRHRRRLRARATRPHAGRPARCPRVRRRACPEERPCASQATAAAAVVFEPLQSNITETRNLAKNFFCTAASSASPSAMLPPPMKIAVFFLSLGPRVKIAPSTRPPTFAALTPP